MVSLLIAVIFSLLTLVEAHLTLLRQLFDFSRSRARTGPGNPGKPWKIFEALETLEKPWNFFVKPWKISQNFIEKINSSNGAFSGLDNKHLKSLAIRASDCQDLLAQIQRVLAHPEIERSQFKFRRLCFYGYSSLLNMNKYVYGKCRSSIVFLPVHIFIAKCDPIIFVL